MPVIIADGNKHRVNKAFIGSDIETAITTQYFMMQFAVYSDRILLNQFAGRFIVAFTLDALNLIEQLTETAAQSVIIIDHKVGLAVSAYQTDTTIAVFASSIYSSQESIRMSRSDSSVSLLIRIAWCLSNDGLRS